MIWLINGGVCTSQKGDTVGVNINIMEWRCDPACSPRFTITSLLRRRLEKEDECRYEGGLRFRESPYIYEIMKGHHISHFRVTLPSAVECFQLRPQYLTAFGRNQVRLEKLALYYTTGTRKYPQSRVGWQYS
jgi:hypothetical protein